MNSHHPPAEKTFPSIVDQLSKINSQTQIIAVSKLQPIDKIESLYFQGQKRFGENYVQEATEKIEQLKHLPEIEWHFIGSLQTNKVKYVVGKFELIHSVDSIKLMEALEKECIKKNCFQKILIQINLANEKTKGGFTKEEFLHWIRNNGLDHFPHLRFQGLMTMPPLENEGLENKKYFDELVLLQKSLIQSSSSKDARWEVLSMGTSSDYEIAALAGATYVRLGTILFGSRHS